MSVDIAWPTKFRELHSHHFDSTIWNDFQFRNDDIIIATYAKSGTLWMQQIVAQMLFNGDADLAVAEMSPWLDLRVPPKEVRLPPADIRRIASFLDIPIDETRWPAILEYCSFDWMKKNAAKTVPLGGAFWDGGAEVFINKGVNGRWMDTLTSEESSQYETHAMHELGPECASWLAYGHGT